MKVLVAITLILLVSVAEQRKIKVFTLNNGMKVLFRKTKHKVVAIASAAKAGTAYEPKNEFGLAHMTEHALFLGSKYDCDSDSFFNTIGKNNGKFNGFTETYGMGIYFRLPKKHFKKGLKLFGPIISNPSFVKQDVEKERAAVNSEFERNVQTDTRRGDSILKYSANKGSLYNKFSTGNTETLKGDIRNKVKMFYDKTYTTNSVKLIVIGNFKQAKLKKMLDANFNKMGKGKAPRKTKMKSSFTYFKSGKVYVYDSLEGSPDLNVMFIIPSQFKNRNRNYTVYLAELLNNEASGSLSSSLKEQGFITGMRATSKDVMGEKSGFSMSFILTKKGVNESETVLKKAFAFLNALKERMVDKELFHKVKKSKKWGKPGKRNILKILSDYTHLAWKVPAKRLDSFAKMIGNWNEQYLKEFLKYIVFSNAIIRMRAQNVLKETKICKSTEKLHEKWMKFDFWKCNLSADMIYDLNSSTEGVLDNIFKMYTKMPKNISLRKSCHKDKKCIKNFKTGPDSLAPVILKDTAKIRLFYLYDTSYMTRKTHMMVKFVFNVKPGNAFQTTLLLLIRSVLLTKAKDTLLKEKMRKSRVELIYNPV